MAPLRNFRLFEIPFLISVRAHLVKATLANGGLWHCRTLPLPVT